MDKSNLFTARGRLLISVMEKPGITVSELSKELFLTRRSVWGMIGELRSVGYLIVRKAGKAHHYSLSEHGLTE